MSCEIRLDYGVISAVFLGLFLFGVGYNAFVAWLERKGYTEGFLSLIVAFGVAMTLVGVAILNVQTALLTLLAFIFSGTPMILGSIARYLKARENMIKAIIAEVKKHDQTA
ncbi:MAG: hypothetical protein QXS54_00320 [Candidatus Methanomethylicaceae archaeon]